MMTPNMDANKIISLVQAENRLVVWSPPLSVRGNPKVPTEFPRFSAKSFMWVLWGDEDTLGDLYRQISHKQHAFFGTFKKYFKGNIVQGEYSKKGLPHLQGTIYFNNAKSSTALYKLFCPWIKVANALQVEKCQSVKDAWHYCAKPVNKCDCEHCEKARLCQCNWAPSVVAGDEPVGRGKKFIDFQKAIKETPTEKVLIEDYGHLHVRYGRNMREQMNYYRQKKMKKSFKVAHGALETLSNYQMALCIQNAFCIDEPEKKRDIGWVWSYALGTGKTTMTEFTQYLIGLEDCLYGVTSFKHLVNAYAGERFINFNFPNDTDPSSDEYKRMLRLIELCDDGGFLQSPMWMSEKKVLQLNVWVTANIPPPEIWTAEGGRISRNVCLDPPTDPNPRPRKRQKLPAGYFDEKPWVSADAPWSGINRPQVQRTIDL